MRVQQDNVVFAYRMDDIFVVGGNKYLRDHGPYGLHMRFPGGASDPTPQLDGSLYFDGGDYLYYDGDLARYYSLMPTDLYTWCACATATGNVAGASSVIYSAYNAGSGGVYKGVSCALNTPSRPLARALFFHGTGGVTATYLVQATVGYVSSQYTQSRVIGSIKPTAAESIVIQNGVTVSTSWSGAYASCVYDTTLTPRIGMHPNGSSATTGFICYVSLLRNLDRASDLAELSAMMLNAISGTAPWPFTVK